MSVNMHSVVSVLLIFSCNAFAIDLHEPPAKAHEWGYRPADGATVEINPPGFTWRPQRGVAGYTLQVARERDFKDMVYEVGNTPWSSHAATQTFFPGVYYYRYAALEKSGEKSAWSTIRRFTVPASAIAFPKPTAAKLKQRIPETHPRLFFRPEELGAFKALAEGDLNPQWQTLVKRAEQLLASPPDTSEPPLYPKGTKRKGEVWKKIWWGNRVHGIKVADGAATLAFVYRLGGEEKYGNAARDLLMAICDWDPRGSTHFDYNDEAAMPLLYYPSRAYTWAYDCFSDADRKRVVDMMRERGRQCFLNLRRNKHLWTPYDSHDNRAWHWLGEVAITFIDDIPEAEEWLDYVLTIFYTSYPVWSDVDGGWHEGTAYWVSYIQRFMNWTAISKSALDIDPFTKPYFSKAGYYGMYSLPPGTRHGGFSDQTTTMTSGRIAGLMRMLAVGAKNPHWQWFAEKHNAQLDGYLGFIWDARGAAVTAEPPTNLPTSRVFNGTGLAVLNTTLLDSADNVQIHFKSSPFGRQSHGYNANNAFLLNVKGYPVFIRSGKRDIYGSPHHAKWMWEAKSDNAILVNGQGQGVHTPTATGHISAFHTSDTVDVVVGEAADSYDSLSRWTRRIIFFKPNVILIHDLLDVHEPATFQWLLHAKQAFTIGDNQLDWRGEPGTVQVKFMMDEKLDITQINEFETPPHDWVKVRLDEWHLTASTTTQKRYQEFLTLITVGETPVTVESSLNGDANKVLLKMADKQTDVLLAPDHFIVNGTTF